MMQRRPNMAQSNSSTDFKSKDVKTKSSSNPKKKQRYTDKSVTKNQYTYENKSKFKTKNSPNWYVNSDIAKASNMNFARPLGGSFNDNLTDLTDNIIKQPAFVTGTIPVSFIETSAADSISLNSAFQLRMNQLFQYIRNNLRTNLNYTVNEVSNYFRDVLNLEMICTVLKRDLSNMVYFQPKSPKLVGLLKRWTNSDGSIAIRSYVNDDIITETYEYAPLLNSTLNNFVTLPNMSSFIKWLFGSVFGDEDNASSQLYLVDFEMDREIIIADVPVRMANITIYQIYEICQALLAKHSIVIADLRRLSSSWPTLEGFETTKLIPNQILYDEGFFNMLTNGYSSDYRVALNKNSVRIDSLRNNMSPSPEDIMSMTLLTSAVEPEDVSLDTSFVTVLRHYMIIDTKAYESAGPNNFIRSNVIAEVTPEMEVITQSSFEVDTQMSNDYTSIQLAPIISPTIYERTVVAVPEDDSRTVVGVSPLSGTMSLLQSFGPDQPDVITGIDIWPSIGTIRNDPNRINRAAIALMSNISGDSGTIGNNIYYRIPISYASQTNPDIDNVQNYDLWLVKKIRAGTPYHADTNVYLAFDVSDDDWILTGIKAPVKTCRFVTPPDAGITLPMLVDSYYLSSQFFQLIDSESDTFTNINPTTIAGSMYVTSQNLFSGARGIQISGIEPNARIYINGVRPQHNAITGVSDISRVEFSTPITNVNAYAGVSRGYYNNSGFYSDIPLTFTTVTGTVEGPVDNVRIESSVNVQTNYSTLWARNQFRYNVPTVLSMNLNYDSNGGEIINKRYFSVLLKDVYNPTFVSGYDLSTIRYAAQTSLFYWPMTFTDVKSRNK